KLRLEIQSKEQFFCAALGHVDVLRGCFRRTLERWLPRPNGVLPGRQIPQNRAAFSSRDLEIRGRQHGNMSDHPIVDIAAEGYETFLVENHGIGRNAGVERQLEFFRW